MRWGEECGLPAPRGALGLRGHKPWGCTGKGRRGALHCFRPTALCPSLRLSPGRATPVYLTSMGFRKRLSRGRLLPSGRLQGQRHVGLPPAKGRPQPLVSAGAAERRPSGPASSLRWSRRRRAPTAPRPQERLRGVVQGVQRPVAQCRSAGPSPRAQGGSSRPVDRHSPDFGIERRPASRGAEGLALCEMENCRHFAPQGFHLEP